MAAGKKIVVTFAKKDPKKNSVRFIESNRDDVSNIYVGNDTLEELGNPDKLKVTIEAA